MSPTATTPCGNRSSFFRNGNNGSNSAGGAGGGLSSEANGDTVAWSRIDIGMQDVPSKNNGRARTNMGRAARCDFGLIAPILQGVLGEGLSSEPSSENGDAVMDDLRMQVVLPDLETLRPETRTPKTEIQGPKIENRTPKQEAPITKHETRNMKFETPKPLKSRSFKPHP